MHAPLVPVTIAFVLGIMVQHVWPAWWPGALASGLLAGLAGCATPRRRATALLLCWMAAGMVRCAAWQRQPEHQLAVELPRRPASVRLHAVVDETPAPPAASWSEGPVLRLLHRRTASGWEPVIGRVRATRWPTPAVYGEEILVEGLWSAIPEAGNPGQYDRRTALVRRGIQGLLHLKPHHAVVRLREGQGSWWMDRIDRLRRRWIRQVREATDERRAGLLLGLLVGLRGQLDERSRADFTATGTMHLWVISGFNVALCAGLLEGAARLLGLARPLRLALVAAGLGIYCVLTGLQPPVTRATLMAWIALGAVALDRVVSWPNTLAVAALGITAVSPMQLFDPGFQLSFAAVLSLMAMTPRWTPALDRAFGWLSPRWLRRYTTVSLAATAAIWVGLWPVLARYFHVISPVSVVANLLLAVPVSALIGIGTAALMAGCIVPGCVRWSIGALERLLDATLVCVSWCARVPWGHMPVGTPDHGMVAGYYVLLVISLARVRRLHAGRVAVAWAAAIAGSLWYVALLGASHAGWVDVDILDVGHGDSIVIRAAGHPLLVVDAGTADAGRYRVAPFLRAAGVQSLGALILTHPDEDHIGGAAAMLAEWPVAMLLTNGAAGDTMSARRLDGIARRRGVPRRTLAAGMRMDGPGGVTLEVLHPPPGLVPETPMDSNDNSLVLRLTKGRVSILLTGDIEEAGLDRLLASGCPLRATVLKVPHHGSRLGTAGEALFRAVRPAVAVLSVGDAHRLPAKETVEGLRRTGALIYSTREDGAVRLRTDGQRLEVRTTRSLRPVFVEPR